MRLPPDSIVALTLSRMHQRIESRVASGDAGQERSGLLFTGNVHDAFPRRLFLDARLSPLDKTAWVMIRLYAQENEGAIFPTYDELQYQLASPHSDKASRETVSRVLLMLRLTGWLSVCRRVRDKQGRVRGNIYAQHDEPLGFSDAEMFDPGWLELVESSCLHKNKSVRMTAIAVLNDILHDSSMRHRHNRLVLVEARLSGPSAPREMAQQQSRGIQSSVSEPGPKSIKNTPNPVGIAAELSGKQEANNPDSENELSLEPACFPGVRKSNGNVRSFTQSVNKKTYVTPEQTFQLPEAFLNGLGSDDRRMLLDQMFALPDEHARQLAGLLREQLAQRRLVNPVGWMFSMLSRARNGALTLPMAENAGRPVVVDTGDRLKNRPAEMHQSAPVLPEKRASQQQVRAVIAAIRNQYR
ncbi:MAG TPA: STY4528 family pathogenicity island replication protein [Scandinavium sp.]